MIKLLRKENLQLFWFVFHAVLGFACVKSMFPLVIWFYIVCIGFVVNIFAKKDSQFNLLCFLGYTMGIEVLSRGVNAPPLIPHEVGKYAALFGFMMGLLMGGPIKRVSIYGVAMLALSIPGLLIMPAYKTSDIVFNYLGPAALFFGVIFCSSQIITYKQFKELLRITVFSIFSLACFAIFKASTFEKIEYKLTANFSSAGGSITNQVATLFGTAICFIVIMYLTGQRLFKYKWMDVTLLLLFSIRGLLTFSRGGMVSAVLAIFIVIVMPKAKAAWQDNQIRLRKISPTAIMVIGVLMFASFFFVNAITNNYLLYRYQGKTERSIQTGFDNEIDLNQITSGRVDILFTDINMFLAYPALGVGVGQSRYLRDQYGGKEGMAASHLEFSRLLAEHGFLGLVLVLMLYIYPFIKIFTEPNNYKRIIMMVFLIMALSATFHNAMRTMITPLLFSFAFLNIVPDNYDWKAHLRTKKRYTPFHLRTSSEVDAPEVNT